MSDVRKCGACGHQFESKFDNNFCNNCIADQDEEFEGYSDCQNCGRTFDEIDHEYQICTYCGYDSELKSFTKK